MRPLQRNKARSSAQGPDALPAEPAWALPNRVRSAGLTFAVGVGHVEGVLLSPAQEGERGLAIQQS